MALSLDDLNLIIAAGFFSLVAILSVYGRFRVLVRWGSGFAADDFLSVLGLVFTVGIGVVNIIGVSLGSRQNPHQNQYLSHRHSLFAKVDFASWSLDILAAVCTKLSILVAYRRTFRNKVFSLTCVFLLGTLLSWAISFFVARLFQCNPTGQWSQTLYDLEHPACIGLSQVTNAKLYTNVVINMAILLAPAPFIWGCRLGVPTTQSSAVCALFVLGGFVAASSIVRAHFATLWVINYEQKRIYDNPDDNDPLEGYEYTHWCQTEAFVALICACLLKMCITIFSTKGQQDTKGIDSSQQAGLHVEAIPGQELENTQVHELGVHSSELVGTEQLPELPCTSGREEC
ncbi:hypothetical protein HD806DRAFT_479888 [Xylariaceae sp. AK1471]|nr:hypothetical protein HD806DRAFT_479888 [Xylariaceae sp. AK1471]